MPSKGPRICSCGMVVSAGAFCDCQSKRRAEINARFEASRQSANQRGYDSKWRRESKEYLARPENCLCACGCGRAADMVDHIIPHRGDRKLFWDRKNWQPMASSPCHVRKKQAAEYRSGL
ncbi:MAG: HNH endonuclease [Proteobacteria bacterium]|nr:HNH endonuclease [Pseudomonadota bacterium]